MTATAFAAIGLLAVIITGLLGFGLIHAMAWHIGIHFLLGLSTHVRAIAGCHSSGRDRIKSKCCHYHDDKYAFNLPHAYQYTI